VPSIGKYVAGGVVALGELYIRKRQAEALRWYVSSADPMVEKLTDDMSTYLSDFRNQILPYEECEVGQALCVRQNKIVQMNERQVEQIRSAVQSKLSHRRHPANFAAEQKPESQIIFDFKDDLNKSCAPSCSDESSFFVSPETAELLIETRVKVATAQHTIDSAIDATRQLAKAHKALNSSLQQKESLADAIQQIEQFVQAVSKANATAKASANGSASNQSGSDATTAAGSTSAGSTN